MKRKRIRWSSNLAYAVGLIATDGCLSKDGRHIILVSKDIDQLENFALCLKLTSKISSHSSSYNQTGKYYHIQFSNVALYQFLIRIGLTPNKSLTLGKIDIPDKYFRDFLRGCLDGDGCTYSYWDPRWKSSFLFYTSFVTASNVHIVWLRHRIQELFGLKGRINRVRNIYQLRFAKRESIILMEKLYYKNSLPCLNRKRFKIDNALGIIGRHADVL